MDDDGPGQGGLALQHLSAGGGGAGGGGAGAAPKITTISGSKDLTAGAGPLSRGGTKGSLLRDKLRDKLKALEAAPTALSRSKTVKIVGSSVAVVETISTLGGHAPAAMDSVATGPPPSKPRPVDDLDEEDLDFDEALS